MVKTGEFALTSYFDCKTIEGFDAYPKVCITAEVTVGKGKIHHTNTDELKAAIEKAVKTSVWLRVNQKAEVRNEA